MGITHRDLAMAAAAASLIRTRRALRAVVAAGAVLVLPTQALAGASNYSCRFGEVWIGADVHRQVGLLLEDGGREAVTIRVPRYFSGGGSFVAHRGRERIVVRLGHSGPSRLGRRGLRSMITRTSPGALTSIRRGVCAEVSGGQAPGRLAPGAVVRAGPRSDAAVVDADPGPLAWSWTGAATRTPGWVSVSIWSPGSLVAWEPSAIGFVPAASVALPRA